MFKQAYGTEPVPVSDPNYKRLEELHESWITEPQKIKEDLSIFSKEAYDGLVRRSMDSSYKVIKKVGISANVIAEANSLPRKIVTDKIGKLTGTVIDVTDQHIKVILEKPTGEVELTLNSSLFPETVTYADRFELEVRRINGYRTPIVTLLSREDSFFSEETKESLEAKKYLENL